MANHGWLRIPRVPRQRRPGQALVEFALILPVLGILLLGLIDTSMLFGAKNGVNYACRQAARLVQAKGNIAGVDASAQQAVVDALRASRLNLAGLQSLTIYYAGPDNSTGTVAQAQSGDNAAAHTVYTYAPATNSWALKPTDTYPVPGTGTATQQRNSGDYIGITLAYRYSGFTPLYAHGLNFIDVTNTQIDPQTSQYLLPTPVVAPPAPTSTATPTSTPPATYTPAPTNTPRPTYTPAPTYSSFR